MNARPIKAAASILMALVMMSAGCEKHPLHVDNVKAGIQEEQHIPLPYFGETDVEFSNIASGTRVADTVYYSIPKFSFTGEDGQVVSHRDYQGKIFVADFFFTECPSICPILSSQMSRLQAMIKKEGLSEDVMFLSHSVKPAHDTPEVLKAYGVNVGADFSNWHFVTGNEEDIYDQAQDGYMLTAFPSDTAQGGIFHTDKLTLVDRGMHIRGYYDGTSTRSVDQLFEDIKKLFKEQPRAEGNREVS